MGYDIFVDDSVGILLPFYIGHGFYREIGFEFQINIIPRNCVAVCWNVMDYPFKNGFWGNFKISNMANVKSKNYI